MLDVLDDANKDTKEGENTRRLSEVESKKVSISRRYSFSVGVSTTPKNWEKSVQYSRDNKRYLGYGPNTDMCLWNAFDAQRVSSQCASTLIYLNDSDNLTPYQYENDSNVNKEYTKISICFSGATLCFLILYYILTTQFLCGSDDNERDEDHLDSEHDEYQHLDETKGVAFVAVPVQIV